MPRTVMFYTGSHDVLLFRLADHRIRIGELEIAEGITVSGLEEHVQLPQSCDLTGKFSFYPTCAPGETGIAAAPLWLDRIINFAGLVDEPGFATIAVPADMIGVAATGLDQEKVRLIAESFEVTGIRTPLFIRTTDLDYQFELLSDPHEFEAMKLRGFEQLPCIRLPLDDLDGRLWQIAQLLNRPKVLVLDWAELIVEWVHLVKIKAAQVAHPRGGVQPNDKGFSLAGRVLGVSRRDVERAHKIASIRAEAKAEIRRLNLNVKRQLVQIGAAPEEVHLAMVYQLTRDRTSDTASRSL